MKWTSSFKYLPINYGMTLATLSDKTQRVLFENNLTYCATSNKLYENL